MKNLKLSEKVRSLPARQQIALWVILKRFNKETGTSFSVSDFTKEMTKFLISKDPENLGKIVGGVLSSLVRNGMIEQLTGGRNTIWTVTPELHKNAEEYAQAIFPVVTYWEKQ